MSGGSRASWLGLAAILLGAAPAAAAAPPFLGRSSFHVYGEDDGLLNPTVECLLQDRLGFLWIGTQDGLFRFDGVRFVRFGRAEGMPSGRVNALHETRDGRLYVGTRGGLVRVAGERVVMVGAGAGLPEQSIPDEGVASARDGTLFVATPEGLFVGDASDRFHREPRAGGAPEVLVTGLHVDPADVLYFARGSALSRRVDGRTEEVAWSGAPSNGELIDETLTDGDGRLWVRTLRALYVRDRGESAFRRDDLDLPAGVSAGRLALDDAGRILVPTERGLARQSDGAWRLVGRREGLPGDTTQAALVDREGSLWIGLAGDGLVRRAGRGELAFYGAEDGLSHSVVWSIARERGTARPPIWIGTQSGLDRLDTETGGVRTWTEKDGLAGDVVYGLAASSDGSVWAGSWPGGITRMGPEAGRLRRYGIDGVRPGDAKIHAVFVASNGDVWAGVSSGAARLAGGATSESGLFARVKLASDPAPVERDNVFAFTEDHHGDVWGVGRHGLQRLTGASPRRFTKGDGLRDDFLASIVALADHSLLVGYREAEGADIVRVEGDALVASRVAGADKILFVGTDAAGDRWLGTAAGVRLLRPDGSARRFARADGLPTEDMDQNAFFADADGSAWFGTSRGLVRARASAVAPDAASPPVVMTGRWGGERRLDVATRAVLDRGERNVRLAWSALTFIDPQKVRYRYRLRGLDDAFVDTDSREVRFPALGKGPYHFEVVAVSSAGKTSDAPATFDFEIRPAWWERSWAYVALVAVLLGLGWGAVQLRVRSLRRRAAALEALVQERTTELADRVAELARANSELLASNERADRIFTALAEALPGTVIDGKYRLGERVGRGGFGVVFRAEHLEMKREVAVKVFRPAPGNDSADALERFRREAQAASRIHHPNAIVVHDSGISAEGIAYMVMELLDGPTLMEARRSGMLTVERCLDTLVSVCDALEAAHASGIIHRDMKPENVILHRATDGSTLVKVVDFGIASLIEDDARTQPQRLTRTHALLGTPGFIAPERLASEPYDGRSDVYAVGVMAYELFAAQLPFGGDTNALEALVRRLHEGAPSMRGSDPSIPEELDALVLRALRRVPAERPAAGELARELEALRASLPDEVLERTVREANLDDAPTIQLGARAQHA